MKKILFLTAMILSLSLSVFAWQDPCSVVDNVYVCDGIILDNWVEEGPQFSPAPRCAGSVILWASDGTGYTLNYIGNDDIVTIYNSQVRIPCRVNDQGSLECTIVTVPEESTVVILGQQK